MKLRAPLQRLRLIWSRPAAQQADTDTSPDIDTRLFRWLLAMYALCVLAELTVWLAGFWLIWSALSWFLARSCS